jgi:cytochrome c oxidase subunit III
VKEGRADSETGYGGSKIGMWLFLASELLFFGGLFLLYAVFRLRYAQGFHAGAAREELLLGAANTMILLTGSLGMAVAVSAARKGDRTLSALAQGGAVLLGAGFLVIKGIEWGGKIGLGLYPGSQALLALDRGEILYFGLYFTMTGLHALHVLIGICLIAATCALTWRGRIGPERFVLLENTALFWHFVDVIWVFLFPLFYLVT